MPVLPPPCDHVVILGLGPSLERYVDLVKRLGSRSKFSDQVWAINAVGDIVNCDLVFHMDDVRIQEIRARARPESNIAAMLAWIRRHPGPVMTSRLHPDYPGLVEYPLADVINSVHHDYLNNTAAHAVAYAIHTRVRKISLFGCDYTYANSHDAERGRGCVEFLLGIASARGIELAVADRSSLMDANLPIEDRIYGYDGVHLKVEKGADGLAQVTMTPRERLPSADEIERRYDHSKPPSKQTTRG